MNIKQTISNYVRAAMLLLVTTLSIEAQALGGYDLSEATIKCPSQILLGNNNLATINYKVFGDENELTEGEDYNSEADYYVEVTKIGDAPEVTDKKINSLTINMSNYNSYTLAKYTLTVKATEDYNSGEKTVNFCVVRFEGSSPFIVSDNGLTLDLLAECVKYGLTFNGLSFKLGTDITYKKSNENNYTPIGGYYNNEAKFFEGSFDGDGHTITGVNINSSSGDIGLFGGIRNGAVVKNLTLSNASITSINTTGGIVGNNVGGTITNCHVTSDVTISASAPDSYIGGIVGNNGSGGTVSNCSSAATITAPKYVGGIAGYNESNGTLSNNVVVGATISATSNYGAIAGYNKTGGILNHNYYADCGNIGGCNGSNINTNDGAMPAIALYDTKNNSEAIASAATAGGTHSVILSGRTLYKDGNWNTLCLPFSISNFSGTSLEGATVKTLESASFDSTNGELTMNFTENTKNLTAIEAGKPYIVKWESGVNIESPIFTNVTIAATTPNDITPTGSGSDGSVTFKGTFDPVAIGTDGDNTKLYLGNNNKLYWPSGAKNINSFRAYFQLNGITAGDKTAAVRTFNLNFDDDPTGITTPTASSFTNSEGAWYDLQGRKIAKGQLSKGIYIHNGKKVVIK